ncbi:DsbA family protein [Jiella sonneratiae]|uniref:DsbA family protein n=1 Tax=Jiella sonneratiae TaxID=2816856 RepID=A0ABS3IZF3_9HYPH|nr:DsbA family protein [Jiella sonneratiae]MBO0902795.1 DsbA family protein [Jiella sonneratiae]
MTVQSAKPEASLQKKTRRSLAATAALAALFAVGAVPQATRLADAAENGTRPLLLAQASSSDAAGDAKPAETAAKGDVKLPEPEGHVDVEKLMAKQALPDVVIGDAKAPVTIVEYASMTCSHCRDFHQESYPQIKKDYIDTGKAKLIIREFPFDPRALAAFMLARCAGDDAKRIAMVDVLFDQQPQWAYSNQASAELLKISRLAGMTEDQFKACLNDKELQKKVVDVQQAGENEFGVNATPTFFVNGDKYAGALGAAEMGAVIEKHM